MRDAIEVFFDIIVAIAGAVFFGSLAVAIIAVGVGCVLFGSCWGFLGWRRRCAAKRTKDAS